MLSTTHIQTPAFVRLYQKSHDWAHIKPAATEQGVRCPSLLKISIKQCSPQALEKIGKQYIVYFLAIGQKYCAQPNHIMTDNSCQLIHTIQFIWILPCIIVTGLWTSTATWWIYTHLWHSSLRNCVLKPIANSVHDIMSQQLTKHCLFKGWFGGGGFQHIERFCNTRVKSWFMNNSKCFMLNPDQKHYYGTSTTEVTTIHLNLYIGYTPLPICLLEGHKTTNKCVCLY